MNSHYLNLPVGQIHYLSNTGRGPCLLMLHGNSSAAAAFSALSATLGERYRVLAIDLPGHGLSDAAPGHYSFAGYARMLVQLITALELTDYYILGHSLGGHAALEALPALPGLRGLILLGAPPFNSRWASQLFAADPSEGLVFTDAISPAQVGQLARAFIHDEHRDPQLQLRVQQFIRDTDPAVRAELGLSLAGGEVQNEIELLTRHPVPSLLLQGREDAFIQAEQCQELSRLMPHLEVVLIDACGHCPHLEAPRTCQRLLEQFVRQTQEMPA